MISSFNILSSPTQSRRIDRVIAAPFQNGHNGHNRTTFPHAKVDKPTPIKHVDFRSHSFTPLEPPSTVSLEKYCGPTTESNWVIPGVLLVGAYPASEDDTETFDLITGILKLGIRKFACLQLEYRDDVPPEQWRIGKGLRPYFQDVKHIVQNKTVYFPNASSGIVDIRDLSFDHLPIVDCGVTDDERVLQLCRKLVSDITRGEVIYLHCWGGHGRTGTVVSIMLHLMYGMTASEAMCRCQLVHDLRICPVNVGSPQTQTQRDQVIRIVGELQRQYKTERVVFDSSNDSLTSTVRMSRSGSSDHEEGSSNINNGNSHSGSAHQNIGRLTRNVHSFNSNSGGNLVSGASGSSLLPKTTSRNNLTMAPLTPIKSASTGSSGAQQLTVLVVQDSVTERVNSPGSTVRPLPALASAVSSSGVTDFHKTIPRPDASLSPQKKPLSVLNSFRSPADNNEFDLSDSELSPASAFHRQSCGSESVSRSPLEFEGFSGSALRALSMKSPSSEESTERFKGVSVDYARDGIHPISLEDLLPDPSYNFDTERQSSVASNSNNTVNTSTERQLSTASQPMSVSSEMSDALPLHLEGGVPIKRNISCTLNTAEVSGELAVDDNLSTQVRKASATNANNHNFQQKEPVSQPSSSSSSSGVSYTISQVLNVARQVLLSGGRNTNGLNSSSNSNSPTNASSQHHSNNNSSGSSSVAYGGSNGSAGSLNRSIKTPTPPAGTAPSSKSSRRQL